MQTIIHGVSHLSGILERINCGKLFVVADSSYPFLNIKDSIEALPVAGKVMFCDFTPNPLYEQVCKGVELFETTSCDAILAVGGGSAIDVAKCIKLAVLAEEGDKALIPPLVSRLLPIEGSRIPFIAIPTTAGTGSESTHNAVMYFEGAKQTVTNDGVLPDFAVLEPSVLKTLPLYQKKCTMMDALCQGIESWWSVNSTEESRKYSKQAVELIMASWQEYIFENDDRAAAQVMLAANFGGRAIHIAQTTAAHAMSYKVSSLYGLPHGHAVAVCLPRIWDYMVDHMERVVDARGELYLRRTFSEIASALGKNHVKAAIRRFSEILSALGLLGPVSENKERDLDLLIHAVNPVRLKNNPVELSRSDIQSLYDSIIQ
ncbi:MAG: phosphonoacetaldehyde reductase [Bacteroidales bacterium]|nr:phosphonoacetaldehyde reductase [Bacteroidales bacterium]